MNCLELFRQTNKSLRRGLASLDGWVSLGVIASVYVPSLGKLVWAHVMLALLAP